MLNARNLVAGRSIVLSDLCFDNDLRIELARDNEVRRLIKSRKTLGPFGLPIADPGIAQYRFYGRLSPTNSETESRWPANGRPRNRSYKSIANGAPNSATARRESKPVLVSALSNL
jgi:hypothetical protein